MKSSRRRVGIQPLARACFLAALLPALLLAGCGGGSSSDSGGGNDPPAPTLTLTANSTTITVGDSIALSWSATNATSCTASGGWSGDKATSGNQNIAAGAAGSVKFTLSCSGAGGSISRSATVTVSSADSSSPTLSLAANPGTVNVGSSFTLDWSTTNATSCTASGGWTGARQTAGSESFTGVTPGTITYTLACVGAGGSVMQSVAVTINSTPQATLTLTADPATVAVGAPFTLQWTSTNVANCTASGAWSGNKATSGSQRFTATSPGTATFNLACAGDNGSISRSATVTITQAEIGQPFILVTVIGFTPYAEVPGLLTSGKSALVYVDVWNQTGTAAVTDATVSINGTVLPYDSSLLEYVGELNVSPGATITASVTVAGVPYVASTRQFDTYPAITTPYDSMAWTSSVANEIRWNGTPSRPGAQLLLGMLGPSGQNWPSSGWVNPGNSATSYIVPAGALSALDYVLLVGYADIAEFPGAQAGSAFVLGGFDYRYVSVHTPPPGTPNVTALTFKTQPPVAVGVNGTKQMAVQATVDCCISSDWTTKADWSSSNTAILTVNSAGIVTGVAAGTANVIATYNGVSASMPVRVLPSSALPVSPPMASAAFQADHTHAGYLTLGQAPALPLTNRWTATFAGRVSYPLVANGRVFVVVDRSVPPNGVLGTSVYALDVNTGATLWGPLDNSSSYRWAAHTYANGKLFVITAGGLLRALDAATGAVIWSVQMPGNMGYSAPPVAVNGLVYLSAGSSGQMFAVDQQDGAIVWTASAQNGMDSSPTLASDGLFVSYACDTHRLDPLSGDTLWHYRGACASGGGGSTSVLAGNQLFATVYTGSGIEYRTFNVTDGAIVSGFAPGGRPAVAGGTAYFVSSGVLRAVDIATNTTRWTYAADPTLSTAPLVIDNMVAVGSSSGAVYLIDAATGNPLWSGQAAAGVSPTSEGAANIPTGLGAGGGYLLVPGGSTLTGWKMVP